MFHQYHYCPKELLDTCPRVVYPCQAVLAKSGEYPAQVLLVLEGIVNIKYLNSDGRYVITSHFLAGDYVGEINTLLARPYEMVAQAASQVTALQIPAPLFESYAGRDFRLMRSILQSQHNRIIFLEAYSIITRSFSLYKRTILFFLGPMRQACLSDYCTKEYIAEYFDTDIRCVNRVLRELTAKGILESSRSRFVWEEEKLLEEAGRCGIDYYAQMFSHMFVEDERPQLG